MAETRVKLAENAQAELFARYSTRAEAELNLAIYLRGIIDALGIPAAAVTGFDDVTGELLLAEETVVPEHGTLPDDEDTNA